MSLEGAELDEAKAAVGREGIPEFIDADLGAVGVAAAVHQEIAKKEIVEREVLRGAEGLRGGAGNLQFVEGFVGGFVDARGLRAGAHVGTGEGVAEGGVVLKIADDGGQQRGEGEEGRVEARGRAEDEVGAAASADLAAVELELAGAEADGSGGGVELVELVVVVGPGGAGRDVDFEDAGVAGEADGGEGRIGGRGVAGEDDVGEFEGDEGGLDVGEELEVGGEQEGRDKDDEGAIADLRGEGAAEIFFA